MVAAVGTPYTTTERSFWDCDIIAPIPLLAELRNFVLQRSATRLPKWRFRLAEDLVVQIQPKVSGCLFTCRALEGPGITSASFQSLSAARGLAMIDFTLLDITAIRGGLAATKVLQILKIADGAEGWALKPYRGNSQEAVRARVVRELCAGRFGTLSPAMILSGACLICGKVLTDPASIARWIGPECFGSGSLSVPRTVDLSALGGVA